jgi:5'-nucleotidase
VIGGKRATSASSFGRVLTDANLRVDRRSGQAVSVSATNSIVTQDVAKDPAQTAILNKYTAIAAPIANRRIGAATAPLTTEQNAAGEEVLGDHRRLPARGDRAERLRQRRGGLHEPGRHPDQHRRR